MLQLFIGVWLLAVIITAFINTKTSVCLLLAYMLFVPFMEINAGIHLGQNFIYTAILLGFLVSHRKRLYLLDFKIFKPFFFLYAFYLVMMVFQTDTPFSVMMNSYRVSIMSSFILPFVMWNEYRFNPTILKAIRKTLLICITIICIYGLFLTQTQGINPWLIAILPLGGSEFNEGYTYSGMDGRIFGRISSTFSHPMTYGLFLCTSLIFVWSQRDKMKWYLAYIMIGLIGLNILLCGVRSAIGGAGIGICIYLLLRRKIKTALQVIIIGGVLLAVVQQIPGMKEYVGSITDVENKNEAVNGSSIDMRIEQLNGCFAEISKCPLEGKGYGWVGYYKENHGDHPVILSFESLIYVVLCENGYLGIVAWIIFIIMLFKMKWKNQELRVLVPTLFATYIAYSCITGEYGYLKTTLIIYVMILMSYWTFEESKTTRNKVSV